MRLVKEFIEICCDDTYVFLEFIVFILSVVLAFLGYFSFWEPIKFFVVVLVGVWISRRNKKNEV